MKPCALCLARKPLRKSHVIPNAIFKRIFKQSSGKAISIADDTSTPVSYSQDSYWEHLLCADCEHLLNIQYEGYALDVIRERRGKAEKHDTATSLSQIDTTRLQLFILSVYWRAAVSTHEAFAKVYIPDPWREEIRKAILNKTPTHPQIASIKLYRLIDPTENGGFSDQNLKDVIITPFSRKLDKQFSFHFILEGFFIEIHTPGLRYKGRQERGVLLKGRKALLIPHLSIFDIPEVLDAMVSGYGKHLEGNHRLKE
ncbi:hypothetical protein [Marinobacterium litorale]|uniref:hypothetical protein n=1 Tax=Marinobacterium litorale TaxID=404770 RepID=UPI0006863B93|nr:hypothetical protein [Marinobacterium litorale]